MTATPRTHAYEQLKTLRANTARDLAVWREVLAEFEARHDSIGAARARLSIERVGVLIFNIDALLAGEGGQA